MFVSRQATIQFLSHLNDYYCDKKKGSYGLKFLDTYSYEATRIDDSLPRKEKDPGSFTLPCYINNVFLENALANLGANVSVMPFSTYLNLGLGELVHTKLTVELADIKLTVELADRTVKHPNGIAENVLVGIGKFVFPVDFIILDMSEDVKVPLILKRPFFSTAHAKIDVFKRKITLRFEKRMELDLKARLMGETLVLNRSLDPLYGDYMGLNDLNVPLEHRRDQVNDLMPTIKEGKVLLGSSLLFEGGECSFKAANTFVDQISIYSSNLPKLTLGPPSSPFHNICHYREEDEEILAEVSKNHSQAYLRSKDHLEVHFGCGPHNHMINSGEAHGIILHISSGGTNSLLTTRVMDAASHHFQE
ncbi:hypothetical protein Tco_0582007 [Tanacetum coccineum]